MSIKNRIFRLETALDKTKDRQPADKPYTADDWNDEEILSYMEYVLGINILRWSLKQKWNERTSRAAVNTET